MPTSPSAAVTIWDTRSIGERDVSISMSDTWMKLPSMSRVTATLPVAYSARASSAALVRSIRLSVDRHAVKANGRGLAVLPGEPRLQFVGVADDPFLGVAETAFKEIICDRNTWHGVVTAGSGRVEGGTTTQARP